MISPFKVSPICLGDTNKNVIYKTCKFPSRCYPPVFLSPIIDVPPTNARVSSTPSGLVDRRRLMRPRHRLLATTLHVPRRMLPCACVHTSPKDSPPVLRLPSCLYVWMPSLCLLTSKNTL